MYMNPIRCISLEIPKYIEINETAIINYTVDWINDDGTPLYIAPDGNAGNPRPYRIDENGAIRYIGYDGNDVSITLYMFLNSEFTMLTDSFKPESIEAGTYMQYMRILYAGEPIFFNNETIHGSIKFQLTRPLVFDESHFYVWFKNATGISASLQLYSTEYGALVEKFVPGAKQSATSYNPPYSGLSFNDTTQKWSRGDQEFETLPNGLPDYIPKPQPIPQSVPPSTEIRSPFSLPREHWEDFAEFLRSVEKNQDIEITKEWLMAENSAEDFVDDFLNAYPEFLTKNIIHTDSFYISHASAVDMHEFYVYGYYNTVDENLNHIPADNYLICAYDVDVNNKTVLKNGDNDVCTRSASDGWFRLHGINHDRNSESNYMDLQIGISLTNDAITILNNSNYIKFYESDANIRYDEQNTLINLGIINQHPIEYPITHQMYNDVTSMHNLLYSKVLYDAPTVIIMLPLIGNPFDSQNGDSMGC